LIRLFADFIEVVRYEKMQLFFWEEKGRELPGDPSSQSDYYTESSACFGACEKSISVFLYF
jgi:hypothetical protein